MIDFAGIRKKIYEFDDHNPYSHSNFPHFLPEKIMKKAIKLIGTELYNFKKEIESIARPDPEGKNKKQEKEYHDLIVLKYKEFFYKIPIFTYYRKEDINISNVLLISNEPGLSENIDKIYWEIENYYTHDALSKLIKESMVSWLGITKINNDEIVNGYCIKESTVNNRSVFNIYGKIAHFIKSGDNISINPKSIHIDLFPFPQKTKDDINPRNEKEKIFEKLKKFDFNSIDTFVNFIDNNVVLECKDNDFSLINFYHKIYTIKQFCENPQTDKFIFVIGNSAYSDYDKKELIFKLISNIMISKNIKVRVSKNWPLNLKQLDMVEF